jgi:hypothetical protein
LRPRPRSARSVSCSSTASPRCSAARTTPSSISVFRGQGPCIATGFAAS